MSTEMKTTKIDPESLSKLRMLAEREKRSAPSQLQVIIDNAWRANPAELSDSEFFDGMMSQLVANAEADIVTDEAHASATLARDMGVISWGSEKGKCIGTLVDGTRIDVDGNILASS